MTEPNLNDLLETLRQRFEAVGLGHLLTLQVQSNAQDTSAALTTFCDTAMLDFIVSGYSATHGDVDRRALLAHWSKSYLEALLPGALVAALILERPLSLKLADMAPKLAADGRVESFAVTGLVEIHTVDASLYEHCKPLLFDNLQPFIDLLAPRAGLSKRLLWGNVGAYLVWIFTLLVRHFGLSPTRLGEAVALFSAASFPDGRGNPLNSAYQFGESSWRRVCCLRYCLPSLPYCGDCPLVRRQMSAADSR